jgi:ubiquinone/menaquinone biosynthesis C-methylase UbiE
VFPAFSAIWPAAYGDFYYLVRSQVCCGLLVYDQAMPLPGNLRQRIFAWALARFNTKYERFAEQYKQRLFSNLSGTVLEIGPGTGANLRYLARPDVHWIGVEPNPFMEKYLRGEADRLGMQIEIRSGTAEKLPTTDGSVDAVIATLVLCCVDDPQVTLKEILRVLKPGGTFVFIEHVAAPRGTRLRRTQNLITPFWRRLGDGCRPNRETGTNLEQAGFGKLNCDRITAPVPIVSPQILGTAMKPL